jgi:hypothetical protein
VTGNIRRWQKDDKRVATRKSGVREEETHPPPTPPPPPTHEHARTKISCDLCQRRAKVRIETLVTYPAGTTVPVATGRVTLRGEGKVAGATRPVTLDTSAMSTAGDTRTEGAMTRGAPAVAACTTTATVTPEPVPQKNKTKQNMDAQAMMKLRRGDISAPSRSTECCRSQSTGFAKLNTAKQARRTQAQ